MRALQGTAWPFEALRPKKASPSPLGPAGRGLALSLRRSWSGAPIPAWQKQGLAQPGGRGTQLDAAQAAQGSAAGR